MTIKKGLFFAFAAIIILVPIYVAISSQNVLDKGKLYKFKPMANDPFDPFRGQYLRVNYRTDNIKTKFDFDERETAYVSISVDDQGFAFFDEAFMKPPKKKDYLETTIESTGLGGMAKELDLGMEENGFDISSLDARRTVRIKIPANMSKYFISEDDAIRAEKVLFNEQGNIYMGVRILDGQARLDNIFVQDQPILEFLDVKEKK